MTNPEFEAQEAVDNQHRLKLLLVTRSFSAVAPVAEQPAVTLVLWSVRQLGDGDKHFLGWCRETHRWRVSSEIIDLNPWTRRGHTNSGRVYELSGGPGFDGDAEYVWQHWLRAYEQSDWADVTGEAVKP